MVDFSGTSGPAGNNRVTAGSIEGGGTYNLGANTLEVSGSLPLGDSGFTGSVAIPDPALAFATMLRDTLLKRGVKIDGRVRTVTSRLP